MENQEKKSANRAVLIATIICAVMIIGAFIIVLDAALKTNSEKKDVSAQSYPTEHLLNIDPTETDDIDTSLEQTEATAPEVKEAVPYSRTASEGTWVYTNVITVGFEGYVVDFAGYSTGERIFWCKTEEREIIYISISYTDYFKYFFPDLEPVNKYGYEYYGEINTEEPITLETPVRIEGMVSEDHGIRGIDTLLKIVYTDSEQKQPGSTEDSDG